MSHQKFGKQYCIFRDSQVEIMWKPVVLCSNCRRHNHNGCIWCPVVACYIKHNALYTLLFVAAPLSKPEPFPH